MGNRTVFQVSRHVQLLKCETIYFTVVILDVGLSSHAFFTWLFSARGKYCSGAGEGLGVAHVITQGISCALFKRNLKSVYNCSRANDSPLRQVGEARKAACGSSLARQTAQQRLLASTKRHNHYPLACHRIQYL